MIRNGLNRRLLTAHSMPEAGKRVACGTGGGLLLLVGIALLVQLGVLKTKAGN